ncbi:MAG: Ig-like domain-containing protein [Pseudomonadota bacterium]
MTQVDPFQVNLDDPYAHLPPELRAIVDPPPPTTQPDSLQSTGGTVIDLSVVLDNDDIPEGQNITLFIPADQVLEHGTITRNSDGDYVFVPDEGAVGTSVFSYFLQDEDGSFVGGGVGQIEVDNALQVTVSPISDTENYTAFGTDGSRIDLSLPPGSDPVAELIALVTATPQLEAIPGTVLENYSESVENIEVIDNGDGTTTVRFDVDHFALVKGVDGMVYGNWDETNSYEFTLVTNGTTTVNADLEAGVEIDILPLLDVLPGQSGDTVLLEIDGTEITGGDQDVLLDSGATVRFDSATGTLTYIPAEGQTTDDRFDVVVENGGYPRTRTIEIINAPATLVAQRDSAVLFQPEDGDPVTFTFGGETYTVPAGYFTPGELSRLEGVDWSDAFAEGYFFNPVGPGNEIVLGLYTALSGDRALTDKVMNLTFSDGTNSFTMRDYVNGGDTPFANDAEAGQFFSAALGVTPRATATIDPLANDISQGGLTLTDVSVVSDSPDVTVSIVDNQIVISAPTGMTDDITLSYTVTDDSGATSTSFVDVTVSEYSQAEAIERSFAADRLNGAANMPLDGLTFTRNADGDYVVSMDGIESFIVDGDSFLLGPDFIEQMLIQFAITGGAQALQQLHGEETHFDLSDPAQKALYEMFVTVAAELGLTAGEYGDHFNNLLDTDRVFTEMTNLLFGTDAGDAWIRGNIDDAVSSLHVEPGFEALEGLDAEGVLEALTQFFTAEPPTELRGANGEELTAEQKDVIMANYLNQIGFLSTYGGSTPDEAALTTGVEALLDYATDVYAPDAAEALRAELVGDGTIELDLSTLFNGMDQETAMAALISGDYEAFGLTEDEVIEQLGDALFELATAGLEIRNAATNPDQIQGLLGLMAQVFPPNATQAEMRAFINDTVTQAVQTRRLGQGSGNVMDDFFNALDEVGKRPKYTKFKSAGANFRSYSAALTGNRPIAGTVPGPDAGAFLMILVLGTTGLIAGGGFGKDATAAEKMTTAGWLSLLISGVSTSIDTFIGPAGQTALRTGPLADLLDTLTVVGPAPSRTRLSTTVIADDLLEQLGEEGLDDVSKILKSPAAQRLNSARGVLRLLGALGLAGGAGLVGTSLAVQASQTDDAALKGTLGATAGLWLGTSVGAAISGGVNIARSLGVTVGSTGSKVAAVAGKTAGILARATAVAYFIVGAVQGVRAQEIMRNTWNILMREGGPENEAGYFVKPENHDLEPYGDAGAALWGGLASLFGFPPPTGFRDNPPATIEEGGVFGPPRPGGSDIRLKTDIRQIGFVAHLGLPLYSWRYVDGDDTRYVGVMAQELLARPAHAHAVVTYEDGPRAGFYAVDYAALGMQFMTEADYEAGRPLLVVAQPRAA